MIYIYIYMYIHIAYIYICVCRYMPDLHVLMPQARMPLSRPDESPALAWLDPRTPVLDSTTVARLHRNQLFSWVIYERISKKRNAYIYTYIYTYVSICMYYETNTSIYRINKYIYIYMYVHTHTDIYTYAQMLVMNVYIRFKIHIFAVHNMSIHVGRNRCIAGLQVKCPYQGPLVWNIDGRTYTTWQAPPTWLLELSCLFPTSSMD